MGSEAKADAEEKRAITAGDTSGVEAEEKQTPAKSRSRKAAAAGEEVAAEAGAGEEKAPAKKRGRKAAVGEEAAAEWETGEEKAPPKKRGKKAAAGEEAAESGAEEKQTPAKSRSRKAAAAGEEAAAESETGEEKAPAKKRSRKAAVGEEAAAGPETGEEKAPAKKRGKKAAVGEAAAELEAGEEKAPPKKRGRKAAVGEEAAAELETGEEKAPPKKRGRKAAVGEEAAELETGEEKAPAKKRSRKAAAGEEKAPDVGAEAEEDALQYIQQELKIQNKAGQMVPLVFNPLQLRLYQEIQRQRDAGQPVRIIILKARQIGFSTATAALFYQRAATMANHNGMIVAHKADASTNIFNKSKLFWEMSSPAKRPMKKTSNAKELLFENPSSRMEEKLAEPGLRSRILIETAGNKDAGRSATIQDLHLSELAFWPYAEQTLISLMQAVPNLPDTMIIIESTANGVGGAFYKEWRRAKSGESAFVPLFFPWWAHEEYRLEDADFLPTPEEEALAALYGLDRQQLAWRHWCIRASCGGDENIFAQEYPANDEEAFLLSGRPVFDMRALLRAEQASPEPRLGRVVEENGRAQFVEDSSYLRLYREARSGEEYVIGVDVAEGLAGGDWSVMAVVEKSSLQLAALWRGHMDPDLLGREAVLLARYYQGALLAPEANNHGIAVVNAIRRENYGRMYRQRDPDTGKLSERWGFSTTSRTKPLAINLLAKLIREGAERLQDALLIGECMSYAYDEKGHSNAQPGCHDDCVMAMAIAVSVCCERTDGPRLQEADWRDFYGSCSTTGY